MPLRKDDPSLEGKAPTRLRDPSSLAFLRPKPRQFHQLHQAIPCVEAGILQDPVHEVIQNLPEPGAGLEPPSDEIPTIQSQLLHSQGGPAQEFSPEAAKKIQDRPWVLAPTDPIQPGFPQPDTAEAPKPIRTGSMKPSAEPRWIREIQGRLQTHSYELGDLPNSSVGKPASDHEGSGPVPTSKVRALPRNPVSLRNPEAMEECSEAECWAAGWQEIRQKEAMSPQLLVPSRTRAPLHQRQFRVEGPQNPRGRVESQGAGGFGVLGQDLHELFPDPFRREDAQPIRRVAEGSPALIIDTEAEPA